MEFRLLNRTLPCLKILLSITKKNVEYVVALLKKGELNSGNKSTQ